VTLAFIPTTNKNFSKPCTAIVITAQLVVYPTLYFVLNAMMGMRICALYEGSRRVVTITAILFFSLQAGSIILTFMALLPLDVSVWYTPDVGSLCGYDISTRQQWYQASSKICLVVFEFALFAMSLICLVRNSRGQHYHINGMITTFFGLIIRDNVIYFFIAFFSLLLNIIDSVSTSQDTEFILVFSGIVENLFSQFQVCMLGPLMILSALEYDKRHMEGVSNDMELRTLEFARALTAHSTHSD